MDSLIEYLLSNHLRLGALIAGAVAVLAGISTLLWNSFQLRASIRRERLMKDEERANCDELLAQARALMGTVNIDGEHSHYKAVSKHDFLKARQLIDEACAKAPAYAWGHYISGCYHITAKAPVAGIRSLKRAIKLEPRNAIYTNALSVVLQQILSQRLALRGDTNNSTASVKFFLSNLFCVMQAIRYGRKTVRLDRNFYAGMLNYAKLLKAVRLTSNFFQASLDRRIHYCYERAIELEPSEPRAYVFYGDFLLATEKVIKAKNIAAQAEHCCPDSAEVLRFVWRIYVQENNKTLLKEYERKLNKLEGLTRNNAADNKALGLFSFESNSQKNPSANHYVTAHLSKVDEETENAINELIHKRWSLARDQFSALSGNSPGQPIFYVAMAECALELEDYKFAAHQLDQALSLDADLSLAYAMRSFLFYKQGEFPEAMNAARQALAITPDYNWALDLYLHTSIRCNRAEEAAAKFNEDYFITRRDNETLLLGAGFFISIKNFSSAERLLQASRALHRDSAELYLCLCRYHLARQDYPCVLENAQLALETGAKPEQCDYYCVLANKETGNLSAAVELIDRCIEADDKNSSYYYQRARILRTFQKRSEAEQDLLLATQLDPLWLSPLFELGELYIDRKCYPQAIDRYLQAQNLAPENADCQFYLGFCYEKSKEAEKAKLHYQKAIDSGDTEPAAFFNLGALLDNDGDFKQAEILYKKALELDPHYAAAHFNLAFQAWEGGERERALEGFKLAHTYSPRNLAYLERLANVLHSMEQHEQSIQFAKHLLDLDPEHYNGYKYMGRSQQALQQYGAAISSFQAAAALSVSRRADFMNYEGNVYLAMNNLAKAETIYKTIVQQFPENNVAVMNLGNICSKRGEPDQAIDYYSRSIAMDDTYTLAYSNRAFVYYQQDEADKAIADLKIVIELDKKNASAYNDVGAIYAVSKKEHGTAIEYYQQALAIAPNSLNPLSNMGKAYVALERFEEAVPYLLQALEIDSQHFPVYEYLLKAYQALDERESYQQTWATLCAFEAEAAKQLAAKLSKAEDSPQPAETAG